MNERTSKVGGAVSVPDNSITRESVVYPTVNPSLANSRVAHVHGAWRQTAVESIAAMATEHRQLVESVHTTDGISMEQAELQVTAFERYFMDDAR